MAGRRERGNKRSLLYYGLFSVAAEFEPRTHNTSKRAAAEPRVRLRGHSDHYPPPAVPSKPVFYFKQL